MSPKETDVATVEDRLTRFTELVLGGAPPSVILQIAREELGVTTKTEVEKYLKRVHAEIQQRAELTRSEAYNLAVARLEGLFASCLRIQDYKTALATLKELHRLQGL